MSLGIFVILLLLLPGVTQEFALLLRLAFINIRWARDQLRVGGEIVQIRFMVVGLRIYKLMLVLLGSLSRNAIGRKLKRNMRNNATISKTETVAKKGGVDK